MDLDGKISLVTGAGQGIGEGIAKVLAAHGSKVILVDLNEDAVKKVLIKLILLSMMLLLAFKLI